MLSLYLTRELARCSLIVYKHCLYTTVRTVLYCTVYTTAALSCASQSKLLGDGPVQQPVQYVPVLLAFLRQKLHGKRLLGNVNRKFSKQRYCTSGQYGKCTYCNFLIANFLIAECS